MSRKQRPEQEFGSDSFLDVIANIVGILIILIVVVGLKVARQPVLDPNAIPPAVLMEPSDHPAAPLIEDDTPLLNELEGELAMLQMSNTEADAQLGSMLADVAQLDASKATIEGDLEVGRLRLASLEERGKQSVREISDAEAERIRLAKELAAAQKKVDAINAETIKTTQQLVSIQSQQEELLESTDQTFLETQQLKVVLANLEKSAAPTDRLQHRLSPVGEKVEEGEVHFRIDNGRISHIPLLELLERLKSQVQARRSTVMRFSRYEGSVGPVGGYTMNYVVERDSLSTLESLEYGSGGFRVSVSRWTIEPDSGLDAELVDDALRPGSRFRQIIDTAAPGSAVTFWVYPDSFEMFPPLRELAHGLQLRVAARPLPEGTPIIGSPGGSKSTAQ